MKKNINFINCETSETPRSENCWSNLKNFIWTFSYVLTLRVITVMIYRVISGEITRDVCLGYLRVYLCDFTKSYRLSSAKFTHDIISCYKFSQVFLLCVYSAKYQFSVHFENGSGNWVMLKSGASPLGHVKVSSAKGQRGIFPSSQTHFPFKWANTN